MNYETQVGSICLEMIARQTNAFREKLDKLTGKLIDEINSVPENNKHTKKTESINNEINKLLSEKFELDIDLILNEYCMPHMYVNSINSENTLIRKNMKKQLDYIRTFDVEQKRIMKKAMGEKSKFNQKTAQFSGFFSTVPVKIIYNPIKLIRKYSFTAGELSAILMHEVGHLVTLFEYEDRTNKLSIILGDIYNKLTTKDADITYVIDKLENMKITTKEKRKKYYSALGDTPSDNKKIKVLVDLTKDINLHLSTTSDSYYRLGETNSEQAADIFAARFGYGVDVGSAVFKLMNTSYKFVPKLSNTSTDVVSIALLVCFIILTIVSIGHFILYDFVMTLIGTIFYSTSLYFNNKYSTKDMTYDKPVDRYKVIKNEYMDEYNQLKELGHVDRDHLLRIKNSIETIDIIISKTSKGNGIIGPFLDYISSKSTEMKNNGLLIKGLEDLVNNSLTTAEIEARLMI